MKFNTLPGFFRQYNHGVQHAFTFDFDSTREHVLSDAKKKHILFVQNTSFICLYWAVMNFCLAVVLYSMGLSNESQKK